MIKYETGDLIKDAKNFEVIIHGCNCQCKMGRGIALQIKKVFPEAYEVDKQTIKGDRSKLGTITYTLNTKPIIVNAYTQYFCNENFINVDYEAIQQCFQRIGMQFKGKKIGIPKIGAGLARGNWNTIEEIINYELPDEDITCIIWDKDFNNASDILEE